MGEWTLLGVERRKRRNRESRWQVVDARLSDQPPRPPFTVPALRLAAAHEPTRFSQPAAMPLVPSHTPAAITRIPALRLAAAHLSTRPPAAPQTWINTLTNQREPVPEWALHPSPELPPGVSVIQAYRPGTYEKVANWIGSTAPVQAFENTPVEKALAFLRIHPQMEPMESRQLLGHPGLELITSEEARQSPVLAMTRGGLEGSASFSHPKSLSVMVGTAATGGPLGSVLPVGRLISMGFSLSMAKDLIQRSPQLLQIAYQSNATGDWSPFYEELGRLGFDAVMLGQTTQHAFGAEPTVMPEWTSRGRAERTFLNAEAARERTLAGGTVLPPTKPGQSPSDKAPARSVVPLINAALKSIRARSQTAPTAAAKRPSLQAPELPGAVSDLPETPGPTLSPEGIARAAEFMRRLADDPARGEQVYNRLGRQNYLSSDLAMEAVPGWEHKDNRAALYDAARDRAAQLVRGLFLLKAQRLPRGSDVVLVTGPVAAGKSSFIPEKADLIYEVNMSNFDHAAERLDTLLKLGLKPHVVYVYVTPKVSVVRRAHRMVEDGRPVNIAARGSTALHLALPQTIRQIARTYGDRVDIRIVDNTGPGQPRKVPISDLDRLRHRGTEAELIREQQAELDRLYRTGEIPKHAHKALSAPSPAGLK